jgi:hypothetical protein
VGVARDLFQLRASIMAELQNSFLRQVTYMWEENSFILCLPHSWRCDVIRSVKNVVLPWYG